MKNKILLILSVSILTAISVSGQTGSKKNNPVGTWNFEAPYAPQGYTSGIISVALAEKKHTTTMSFTGNESKHTGDKVKVTNDSILFSVFLEGEDVRILLKMENETKMSGKAVYSEGEVPLTLTKAVASDK